MIARDGGGGGALHCFGDFGGGDDHHSDDGGVHQHGMAALVVMVFVSILMVQCLSICPAASIPYSDILCILFQPLPSACQPTLSQTLLSMRPSCLPVCLSA